MCKISVIMPVYNTGIYLKEALESVLAQNFNGFELICVDDCSDDETTINILEKYKNKENGKCRIRIIRLDKHSGAAIARNVGISESDGEYLTFLDADDFFESDYLFAMYKRISTEKADVSICSSKWKYADGSEKIDIPRFPDVKNGIEDRFVELSYVPWNKMIKKSLIDEFGIQFQSLTSCNDVFFSMSLYLCARKIVMCGESPLVTYRYGGHNQTSSFRDPRNICKASVHIWEKYSKNPAMDFDALAIFLTIGLISELNRSCDRKLSCQAYKMASEFVAKGLDGYKYSKDLYNYYIDCLFNKEYDSGWWRDAFSISTKISASLPQIIKDIDGKQTIVLWGYGSRGREFHKICNQNNIFIGYVTDSKYIEESNIDGMQVVNLKWITDFADLVIASNHAIAEHVKKMIPQMCICDLEDYS